MRVLLVDDNDPVRSGLRQLLEIQRDIEVVGEGSNGVEAISGVERHRPDIVIMDMNMPVMNGVEATQRIKESHPDVRVLALTAYAEMSHVSGMVKAGADGYLLKGAPSKELIESLRSVVGGQGAIANEVAHGVMENMAELYKKEKDHAAALAELDRMKSEFISIVSHEIRTPLTTISGGVELMRDRWHDLDEDLKLRLLSSMARQCNRLERMATQIVTVAGIRGGLALDASVFALDDVAREALAGVSTRSEGRDMLLQADEVRARGDRHLIKQVAVALIENALMFTSGSVAVTVTATKARACLSVTDEGPGIDEAILKRLLDEPFVQADSSTTRRAEGLGLSLYMARQVLEASGGALEVDTAPERGSTFTMVIPAAS